MDASARERYERRVRALEGFGHRGSGTAHERRAADYLAAELRGLGLAPAVEPFAGYHALGTRLLLPVAAAAAGAALLFFRPAAGAALAAAGLASLVLEPTTRVRLLSRLLPRPGSQNVVATAPPADGPPRARLVVCGHYDTQRTGLAWSDALWRRSAPAVARLPAWLQPPLLPVAAAMALQAAAGAAGWAAPGLVPPPALAAAAGAVLLVYAVAGALFADWAVRPHVPGAADNASGAAAVLALAEGWVAAPAAGVEAVFLLPGCEEVGLVGAAAWADRHRAENRAVPTVFLNLDGLGFGPPRVLARDVPPAGWPAAYPPALLAVAAEEAGPAWEGPASLPAYTDGRALLARGLPGLTVIGCRPGGYLPNWHLPTDVADRMDFDAAWRGVEYAARLARRLAEPAGWNVAPAAAGAAG